MVQAEKILWCLPTLLFGIQFLNVLVFMYNFIFHTCSLIKKPKKIEGLEREISLYIWLCRLYCLMCTFFYEPTVVLL